MNCKETKIFFQPVFFRFFQINFNQSFSAKTQIKIYFSAANKTAYSTQKNAMTQFCIQTRGTILVSGSVRSHGQGAPPPDSATSSRQVLRRPRHHVADIPCKAAPLCGGSAHIRVSCSFS